MFWNKKKKGLTYNKYEREYLDNEHELYSISITIRAIVADILVKNEACKLYTPNSPEHKITSNEILEKKKKLLKAMGEYSVKRKLVISMLEKNKEHFVSIGKDRVTPLTARQHVEIAIRNMKGK